MKFKYAIVLLIMALTSCAKDIDKERVLDYLVQNYELESTTTRNLNLGGKRYYFQKGRIPLVKKVSAETLENKTGYKFYKTILNNTLSVVPRSTVIIALPITEFNSIHEILSIDPDSNFATIIDDIKFSTPEEKESVTNDISKLFKALSGKGKIQNIKKSSDEYLSELWVGNEKYKILSFSFKDDELIQIKVIDSY